MSRPLKDFFFFFFTCMQFSFKNTFTSESTRQTINLSLYMICPSWPYKYKAFEGLYTQNKARHGVVRTVMQARAFSTPLYLVFHMYRDQQQKRTFPFAHPFHPVTLPETVISNAWQYLPHSNHQSFQENKSTISLAIHT